MVTEVHDENTYCSPRTFSGMSMKNRSNSQSPLRSGNTSGTINYNNLPALQPLAKNNNSANFQNNINKTSRLPNSFTRTMLKFDGKSEKVQLLDDFSRTSLRIHNQLTGENRINYIDSLMRGDAPQTF